jgi:3-carboxy-cis,cis-muconate cycloisomerase
MDKVMPTSLIDSVVFRDIFGTEPMSRVWSDENRTQRYLDIEAALARAQASVGVIPAKAAAEITKQAKVDNIDFEKLGHETERIGYPVAIVAEILVKTLAQAGVKRIYGIVGDSLNGIIDAVRREKSIY